MGTLTVHCIVMNLILMRFFQLAPALPDYVLGRIGIEMNTLAKANPMQNVEDVMGANHRLNAIGMGNQLSIHQQAKREEQRDDKEKGKALKAKEKRLS